MVVPQKVKYIVTTWPSNFILRYVPKKYENICTHKNLRMDVLIAALYVIVKKWKQPKSVETNEWIHKTWYIHITDYSSVMKTQSTDTSYYMHTSYNMLSERRQSQMMTYCMILFTKCPE